MSLWASFLIEISKMTSMYTHHILNTWCLHCFPRSFPVLRVRARSFGKQRERWADRRWVDGQMPFSLPDTQRLRARSFDKDHRVRLWAHSLLILTIKHAKPHWETMYKIIYKVYIKRSSLIRRNYWTNSLFRPTKNNWILTMLVESVLVVAMQLHAALAKERLPGMYHSSHCHVAFLEGFLKLPFCKGWTFHKTIQQIKHVALQVIFSNLDDRFRISSIKKSQTKKTTRAVRLEWVDWRISRSSLNLIQKCEESCTSW